LHVAGNRSSSSVEKILACIAFLFCFQGLFCYFLGPLCSSKTSWSLL
jgi:hypothetical protein